MKEYGISGAKSKLGFKVKAIPDTASRVEKTVGRFTTRVGVLATAFAMVLAGFAPMSAEIVTAASVAPVIAAVPDPKPKFPDRLNGNPTCADLDGIYGGGQTWLEAKVDSNDLSNGAKVFGAGTITLNNYSSGSFDFTSTFGIDAVLVKAGSDSHNLYIYQPGPGETMGDTNLVVGANNGISHISFCYDVETTTNPDPTSGTITVNKVVVNEGGGTKNVGDFSFKVNDDSAVAFEADGSNALTLNFGTYTITELADPSYTTTYNGCSGIALSIPNLSATCTITNTYRAGGGDPTGEYGSLTLVKVVAGGNAQAIDWTLSATGPTAGVSGKTGDTKVTTAVVLVGDYTLSETGGPNGYVASNWVCMEDGQNSVTVNNSVVTISKNNGITCTITNTYREGPTFKILVKKVVVGGSGVASDFTITAFGKDATPSSFDGSVEGVVVTVGEGDYEITEPNSLGHTVTYSEDCTGTFTAQSEEVEITEDQAPYDAECIVTNTFRRSSGGGGGGGSSSGSSTPDEPGRVLGDFTGLPYVAPPAEEGQVLGVTTTLPRTGAPLNAILMVFAVLATALVPIRVAIKNR